MVRSKVLAPELNLTMSIYFSTYIIKNINVIVIITVILVHNLTCANYFCLQSLIIALSALMPILNIIHAYIYTVISYFCVTYLFILLDFLAMVQSFHIRFQLVLGINLSPH